MWQFLLGFILAWILCGWYTHAYIASECDRLGGFFVGSKTYKCIEVRKLDEEEQDW